MFVALFVGVLTNYLANNKMTETHISVMQYNSAASGPSHMGLQDTVILQKHTSSGYRK